MALYLLLALAAAGLEALMIALLRLGNLKAQAVEFIGLTLGACLLYLISVHVVTRIPSSRALLAFVFLAGLAFRATLFPLYPSLSDDLLRYRWDGRAQLAGLNPYRSAPDAPEAAHLRDETWPAVNGKEFTTAYGPLTELVFRETWRMIAWVKPGLIGSVLLMKAPALLFDLGSAVMLALLLRRMNLPVSRVLVYWWCPLTVVEFAASGHNDSIAVFFLLAALAAMEYGRPPLSLAALTASAAAKMFAAFLAPALIAREWRCLSSRFGRPVAWSLLLAAAVSIPYLSRMPGSTLALAIGSGHWRNNDSLFGIVEWMTGSIRAASWIFIAAVAATSLTLAVKRTPLTRAAYLLIGVILTGAGNCFPWYLTWMLPLQAVYLNPAWLFLTAASQLSYHIVIGYQALGVWQDSVFYRALEYVPFYALLLYSLKLKSWRRP